MFMHIIYANAPYTFIRMKAIFFDCSLLDRMAPSSLSISFFMRCTMEEDRVNELTYACLCPTLQLRPFEKTVREENEKVH